MCAMWIWVTKKVGEGNGRKRVIVGEGGFVEFDHGDKFICRID